MKIREENCNMVLLAAVTMFTVVIASGASVVTSREAPLRIADRTVTPQEPVAPAAAQPVRYVSDQPSVRVVGAPFVPNTNPRER
jgi:hypothetical protein